MLYLLCMYSQDEILDLEGNPGMLHVSVFEGRIWISELALEDIETFTGRRPGSENPRQVLEFLDVECAKLQGATFNQSAQQVNFMGYCLMKGLRHAIETKMFGRGLVGEMPDPNMLHDSFLCERPVPNGITVH